jgi:hypothetical protein
MYIYHTILALAAAALAFPSPLTVFNPDGTVASSDGTEAILEPLTKGRKDKAVKWKGPAEKYFHESTVRCYVTLPQPPLQPRIASSEIQARCVNPRTSNITVLISSLSSTLTTTVASPTAP